MPRFTKANAREMGQRGGQSTVTRHGRSHMRQIGVRGFWVTVTRHWDGRPRAFVNYLIALGLAATDPMPENRAFEHDRNRLRHRALAGYSDRLRPGWRPPPIPTDLDLDPPF